MNLKSPKKYQVTFFLLNILFIYITNITHANNSIIQIYSKNQFINTSTNTIFFTDNVILKYKEIELKADKIIIIHDQKTQHLSTIKAYGNPITLNHRQKSKYTISATSKIMYFNVLDNSITFIGNTYIKQTENSIQSDNIIYSINQKKIQAISKKEGKTIIIIKIDLN